jgi:prolyl-tRNA editing enzyme YbaK/EbsC (Cys-tRNA(Pro) deacylase)
MERRVAYSTLAEWFEYLNDDCDYENWSQYLINRLSAYRLDTGLDVGCGGGYFTRALQRAGYEMTGMDVSLEMLDKAQRTALKEGVRGEYIHGDVGAGRIARKYSFATAINDCLNYVEPARIAKTLSFHVDGRVALVLFAGDARIDNRKYKDRFHTKAKMLGAEEAEPLIGHGVGGVCPFGVKEGCDVYLDESLKRFDIVYPAAGTPASAVRLTIDELERACAPYEWVDVSKLPDPSAV